MAEYPRILKAMNVEPGRNALEYVVETSPGRYLMRPDGLYRIFTRKDAEAMCGIGTFDEQDSHGEDEKPAQPSKPAKPKPIPIVRKIPAADIHRKPLRMPRTVYIVGSGPNGRQSYDRIPADAYVIAVNLAVMIPWSLDGIPWRVAVWVASDPHIMLRNFWCYAHENFAGVKVFSEDIAIRARDSECRTFPIAEPNGGGSYSPSEDGLRMGGTVASQAIEFAWMCGAQNIILCGIDMSGDYHYDGTGERGDRRHGKVWECRDGCDGVIEFVQRMGVSVSTMTRTKLKRARKRYHEVDIPSGPKRLPAVGYLLMSYHGLDTHHALIDIEYQDYPDELKTAYVLYQRIGGKFPERLKHKLPFRVVEIDVEGTWPHLWLCKAQAYFEHSDSEITVWWDPDDRYERGYTRAALEPILQGQGDISWSYDCVIHEAALVTSAHYRTPIGALAGVTSVLKTASNELFAEIYEGDWRAFKRLPGINYKGARDNHFRTNLEKKYGQIPQHQGVKHYFVHCQANTLMGRDPVKGVDYNPEHRVDKEWVERIKEEERACTTRPENLPKG